MIQVYEVNEDIKVRNIILVPKGTFVHKEEGTELFYEGHCQIDVEAMYLMESWCISINDLTPIEF